ncbi:MAG: MFS transporter [Deltaproteobacteria bacterium]|nr:MAG: MFS transporter [Deltaproteobacteria bacterium]
MGLAYAFLYMGRYNLTVAKNALGDQLSKEAFGTIFGVGSLVYGFAFLINGPLIDRVGGRRGMLIGTAGALAANVCMGVALYAAANWDWAVPLTGVFVVLYAANMYFQSFGAVSIVTVKAPWFHVRERGTFSTIFGVLIAAGIYFAFDWGSAIVAATRAEPGHLGTTARAFAAVFGLGGSGVDENWMLFFVPATLLAVMWVIMFAWLRNTPGEAGFDDFDTGDESLSDDGQQLPVVAAVRKILTHPVLLWVCLIEFCSGVLRNGVMQWYPIYAKEAGFKHDMWISANWGLALLIAGVVGANATGWVSDKLFQSRRAPMCGISYGILIASYAALAATLGANPLFGGIAAVSAQAAVIAVHGILSGTATADFGGRKNTGIVVGIVDGFVYLGTGLQAFLVGALAPTGAAQRDPSNWLIWPLALLPFAAAGLAMALRIWHALPRGTRVARAAEAADTVVDA